MQMFEKLQELPLLMGLSKGELMSIVERVKFDFNKHAEGTTLVSQGERCDRIVYVLSGTVCADLQDAERGFLLSEQIDTVPMVLEPQNLWGMKQRFARSYSLLTEGSTCSIDKRQLNGLISNFELVKTNVLSLVCNRLQGATALLTEPWPQTTEGRIVRFVRNLALNDSGHKVLHIKMQTLADMTCDTRLNVSQVLNRWQQEGLVSIRRGVIEIHRFEDFQVTNYY